MKHDEKLAYARGYNNGAKWPIHKPPMPPDAITREILEACRSLRDEADGVAAGFGEGDEIAERLWAKVDEFDAVVEKLGRWLLDGNPAQD